ncbi:MAG: hypothetical protein ACREDY_03645, partial [Bradyrhizobium sp.]
MNAGWRNRLWHFPIAALEVFHGQASEREEINREESKEDSSEARWRGAAAKGGGLQGILDAH